MGGRDIRRHEEKKTKKGSKKPLTSQVLTAAPLEPEVLPKGKAAKGGSEGEEEEA